MIEFQDAIEAKWTAATLDASITGGLFYHRASRLAAKPYCIYDILPMPSRIEAYGGNAHFEPTVQFCLFCDQERTGGVLMKAITDAFDAGLGTISGHSLNSFYRLTEPYSSLGDGVELDIDATNVWRWWVEYAYAIQ